MENICLYPAGHTAALGSAVQFLKDAGCRVSHVPEEATHLLLPIPSIDTEGSILGGGPLTGILCQLPKDITVIGGNLDHPSLTGYNTIDLLQDAHYLAQNAAITADFFIFNPPINK